MKLTEKTNLLVPYTLCGSSFASKISQILNACDCSKNLIIGIYMIEHKRFLYCNKKLEEILAEGYYAFIREGWDNWYSLIDPIDRGFVKSQITDFCSYPYLKDQLTVLYHLKDYYGKKIFMKHELLLHQFEKHLLAINYFFDVSDKEKIENCFEPVSTSSQSCFINNNVYTISPREKQVLKLIADGFSSKEIAELLYISNHTAVSHRKNLIEKFQVKNTAHLVRRASHLLNG